MALTQKSLKKRDVLFEGRGYEKFYPTLNISKTGGTIFTKFSQFVDLKESSLDY